MLLVRRVVRSAGGPNRPAAPLTHHVSAVAKVADPGIAPAIRCAAYAHQPLPAPGNPLEALDLADDHLAVRHRPGLVGRADVRHIRSGEAGEQSSDDQQADELSAQTNELPFVEELGVRRATVRSTRRSRDRSDDFAFRAVSAPGRRTFLADGRAYSGNKERRFLLENVNPA